MAQTSVSLGMETVDSPAPRKVADAAGVEPAEQMNRLVRILASRILATLPRDSGIEM
jgi:RNA polymerase sigma factor for flagellar operon FliA